MCSWLVEHKLFVFDVRILNLISQKWKIYLVKLIETSESAVVLWAENLQWHHSTAEFLIVIGWKVLISVYNSSSDSGAG